MGFVSILKVNKYKRFSFSPRYYDERREELVRELDEEKIRTGGRRVEYSPHLRTGYLKTKYKQSNNENSTSTFRLIIIIVALASIFYCLLR